MYFPSRLIIVSSAQSEPVRLRSDEAFEAVGARYESRPANRLAVRQPAHADVFKLALCDRSTRGDPTVEPVYADRAG